MTTVPPVPVPAPAGKGSLSKWLTGHKWEAGLGALGIVATVYLGYRAHENSAANGSTSGTSATTALPTAEYTGTGGYDSGLSPDELQQVVGQLQTDLGTAGGATGAVSGSWGSGSGTFDPVAAGSSIPDGVQLFYEPVPGSGVFDPLTGGVPTTDQLYVMPNASQPTGFQQGNAGGGAPVVVP